MTASITDAPTAVKNGDEGFVVRLEAFSGPLDLLLHLIREQEIDIYDIPIAQIADQFLGAVHQLGLNDAADYLDMAAYLVRIKIQMLLPRRFDAEDWEDPRAELVRRLLEYEQMREVANWLAEAAAQQADRFPRGWVPEAPAQPPRPLVLSIPELLDAVERLIESMPQPILHRVVPRPLDVEGSTARITAMLDEREEWTLLDFLMDRPTVADILSVLLALLELARTGRVRLEQDESFGNVIIRRASPLAAA